MITYNLNSKPIQFQGNKKQKQINKTTTSNNNTKTEKPSRIRYITGWFAGNYAKDASIILSGIVLKKAVKTFFEKCEEPLSLEETKLLVRDMARQNNHNVENKKRIKYAFVNEKNIKVLQNELKNLPPKVKIKPFSIKKVPALLNKLNDILMSISLIIVKEGRNAFYYSKNNKAYFSDKKNFWTAFHEIGHSLNNRILGKTQMGMRKLPAIAGLMFFTSMLHHKKPENQSRNNFDKTKDFIQNNIATLTFASFIPMICEEGMASKRGLDFLKGKIAKSQMNIFRKNYAIALSSYISVGLIAAGSAKLGLWTRDKIVNSGNKKSTTSKLSW